MLLIRNSTYTFLSNFVGGLALFLVNAIVARNLGAELFGAYTFVFAFLSFFAVIANIGLDTIVVRELSRKWNDKVISAATLIKIVFSIAAMAGAMLIINVLNYPEIIKYGVFLAALTLLFSALASLWWSVFQARFEMFWYAVTNLFGRILILAISAGLIIAGKGILWLVAAFSIAGFLQLLLIGILVFRRVKPVFAFDFSLMKFLLKESWPLALSTLFISMYYRLDVLMLSFWRSQTEIGYYAAVYTMTEAPAMLAVAWNASLYPLLSCIHARKKEFTEWGLFSVKGMLLVAVPMAMGTAVLSQRLINLIYGSGYESSVPVLRILIFGGGMIMINVILSSILNALGKQKIVTAATAVNLVLNGILNVWAIRNYGIVGAATTTVLTEFFCGLVMWLYLRKKGYMLFRREWIACFIAAILMGIVVYFAGALNLAILITIGAVAYAIFVLLFGGITSEDKKMLKRLLSS